MKEQLKSIYTYLIDNRKHELVGWYNDYKSFTNIVQTIKDNLTKNDSLSLRSTEAYANTGIDYEQFIRKLLYEKANGISSRGQSVLSNNELNLFISTPGFDDIIKNIILTPNLETYKALQSFWETTKGGKNPVLINRAIAACTLDLSSTVDEYKFNLVFSWLLEKGLIAEYTDENYDWYSLNIFTMRDIRATLKDIEGIDDHWISLFYWEMYENLAHPFNLKKQIVKYGAPGTGKTYKAKETSKLQFDIWKNGLGKESSLKFEDVSEFVQFHPSFSYEDFIEGLRPILDKNGQAQLQLCNGIFKDLCIRAGKWEKDLALLCEEDKTFLVAPNNKPIKWALIKLSDLESKKTTLLQKDHWKIIEHADPKELLSDVIPPFFMLIDEINRAELSRVFGELMYSLEYRGVGGAMKTQYAQLNTENTGMIKMGDAYRFFIPNNLYVIASMNTIDRSVESFDFALRRRFKWEEVLPDSDLLRYHLKKIRKDYWLGLADCMDRLNEKISTSPLLGKDYCIGHAYFWELPYAGHLKLNDVKKAIWEDSISSLLEEYLRGTGKEYEIADFAKAFGI